MKKVEIFTDGACRGNPGPGGWGVLLRCNGVEKTLLGGEPSTTNNRMEMQAVISALQALTDPCEIEITTDSQYVKKGITQWIMAWKKNGWRTAARKPVKNSDLWKILDEEQAKHKMNWHWVKGHSGHRENELVDALANQGVDELLAKEK